MTSSIITLRNAKGPEEKRNRPKRYGGVRRAVKGDVGRRERSISSGRTSKSAICNSLSLPYYF
jgi:hypothetical protein